MFRRSVSTAAALAAIVWMAAIAAPRPAAAAAPDFQVVTDTTYAVRPADRLVHVVVDARATSFKTDTATQRYYYRSAVVVVISGATNFAAYASGAPAAVTVVEQDEQQVALSVSLNRSVFYGQTATFRLDFDLPSGAASGDVRVGANVAAFPVWAVGSAETAGSTVTISVPAAFQLDVSGAEIPEPTDGSDGSQLYRWGPLDDPDRVLSVRGRRQSNGHRGDIQRPPDHRRDRRRAGLDHRQGVGGRSCVGPARLRPDHGRNARSLSADRSEVHRDR